MFAFESSQMKALFNFEEQTNLFAVLIQWELLVVCRIQVAPKLFERKQRWLSAPYQICIQMDAGMVFVGSLGDTEHKSHRRSIGSRSKPLRYDFNQEEV